MVHEQGGANQSAVGPKRGQIGEGVLLHNLNGVRDNMSTKLSG